MGVTAGKYGDVGDQPVLNESPKPYREEGSDNLDERTSFTGTIDTTGVGPGDFEDLRSVTRTFDRGDEALARRVEQADSLSDVESETGVVVEGADPEASPADLADALRNRGQEEASGTLNPMHGDPETVQAQVDADEKRREEEAAEANHNRDDDLVEDPSEGSTKEVEAAVGDDPEKAQAALDAEKEGENRKGLTASLEKTVEQSREEAVDESFDPADNQVPAIKEYLNKVTDAEIKRVKDLESKRKPNPRTTVMDFERS